MAHAGAGSFSGLAVRPPRSSTTVTSMNPGGQRGRRARTRPLLLLLLPQPLEGGSGHRDREGGVPQLGPPPQAAMQNNTMQGGDVVRWLIYVKHGWCVRPAGTQAECYLVFSSRKEQLGLGFWTGLPGLPGPSAAVPIK